MITTVFDGETPAIIQPVRKKDARHLDAVVTTFSFQIEEYVRTHYAVTQIATLTSTTGLLPVYELEHHGKKIGFMRNYIGGPAAVGMLEDLMIEVECPNVIAFGGAGSLDREIDRGRIMIPTAAVRDEGTSYHYVPAADEIDLRKHGDVEDFMRNAEIPYVTGKTWTTDAIYRETRGNFEKRKAAGCISVEMECASLQAVCDFRGWNLFMFLKSGDLLDAPQWDPRSEFGRNGSQHDPRYFTIALDLAAYVAG